MYSRVLNYIRDSESKKRLKVYTTKCLAFTLSSILLKGD